MDKKGALQMSFAWLFAIIVGGFILFLTIYGVTKMMQTEETTQDAKTGKEIGVLLNPLETGFETGKTTSLTMPVETRIYNKCNNEAEFGRQIIQVSQKSFNKWTDTNINVGFSNKYIFSNYSTEGKKFYLFSKPFEFPFKITDVIYLTSANDKYCFLDAPSHIEDEINDLKQPNLFVDDCPGDSINVCFATNPNCDISVDYSEGGGYIEKGRDDMSFVTDALMYAAIFSDKEVYECQLKRIMQRLETLALLYKEKAIFVAQQGCLTNMNSDLNILNNLAQGFEDSEGNILFQMNTLVEELKDLNDNARCALW